MNDDGKRKVACVTGGGRGLGAAISRRLARDGMAVVMGGRTREPLDAVAAEIRDSGGEALAVQTDVTSEASVADFVLAAVDAFGGLDVAVANAGVLEEASAVPDTSLESWQRTLDVNLTGPFLLARAAVPHLAQRGGAFVSVGSVSSVVGGPISASYCSAKAGVMMLTQCLAVDHGHEGVRANCVLPGWIQTDMGDIEMDWIAEREGTDRAGAYDLANEFVPMRRAARPEEVADAVAFLASPAASYVNGAALPVDGGSLNVWAGVTTYMPKWI